MLEPYELGQLYKELATAVYGKRGANVAELQNARIFPMYGISLLITKAHALHKVTPQLDLQIMYVFNDLPDDVELGTEHPLSLEQQSSFILGYQFGLGKVAPPNIGLQAVRNRAGLTAKQLAEKIGVTLRQVQRWESGDSRPPLSDAQRLAELLDTDINVLFPPMKEQ